MPRNTSVQCVIFGTASPDSKLILLHGYLVVEQAFSFIHDEAKWQVDCWNLMRKSGYKSPAPAQQTFVTFAFEGAICNAFSFLMAIMASNKRTKTIKPVLVTQVSFPLHPFSFSFRTPTPCVHLGVRWMKKEVSFERADLRTSQLSRVAGF